MNVFEASKNKMLRPYFLQDSPNHHALTPLSIIGPFLKRSCPRKDWTCTHVTFKSNRYIIMQRSNTATTLMVSSSAQQHNSASLVTSINFVIETRVSEPRDQNVHACAPFLNFIRHLFCRGASYHVREAY